MKLKVEAKSVGLHLASMLVAMLLVVGVSTASPITYSVNRTIGAGSVTGTIQTDGSLGVLAAANITDWNLTLFDGTSTFVLTGPASGNNSHVFSSGSDITATASNLFFNFSGVDSGYLLFQVSFGSGQHYYCDATFSGVCSAGERVVPQALPGQLVTPSGNVVIGVGGPVSGPVAVPTLSDWRLIVLAALLFLATLWMGAKPDTFSIRVARRILRKRNAG
jgi:hypothetical protein